METQTHLPDEQGSYLTDLFTEYEPATKNLRFVNYIIDVIAFYALSFCVGIAIAASGMSDIVNDKITMYAISFFLFFLYYFIFELASGKTIGKLFTGTKVVSKNGSKPTTKQILLRSFSRLVPFEPFSFLGHSGWHDRWSDTVVIKNK